MVNFLAFDVIIFCRDVNVLPICTLIWPKLLQIPQIMEVDYDTEHTSMVNILSRYFDSAFFFHA